MKANTIKKKTFIVFLQFLFFLSLIITSRQITFAQNTTIKTLPATDSMETVANEKINSQVLEEVSMIGSRSSVPRTKVESAVPVDIITSKDMQRTGQIELGQMMQFIAPSFNSTKFAISNVTSFVDPATLRGLGPDQTLVLVNGKRRHQSAALNPNNTVGRGSVGTDLNSIPAFAIEKVEILRDGAAAQYGSDAIAGVINIVLKKNIGWHRNFYIGQSSTGDGITYEHSVNYGLNVGKNGGFLNMTGWFHYNGSTNRGGHFDESVRVYDKDKVKDDSLITARNFNRNVSKYGQAENTTFGAFYNFELPLSKINFNLYSFGGYTRKDMSAFGFFRAPIVARRTTLNIFPNGYAPIFPGTSQDVAVNIGIRRDIQDNKWGYDFSGNFGQNTLQLFAKNTINPSLGDASPTSFFTGASAFKQSNINFNTFKAFNISGLKSFIFSTGAELRWENYSIKQGDEASWKLGPQYLSLSKEAGSSGREGFSPETAVNKGRISVGIYTDVETELNKYILLTGALRFENYSDFGANLSGKIAARIKLNDHFSFRGAYSRGFRAPSLHQLYYSNYGDIQWTGGVANAIANLRNDDSHLKAIGVAPLKAETSNNFSLGLTTSIKNFLLTIDAYQINVNDRVVMSGQLSVTGNSLKPIFSDLQATQIQFFSNAVSTLTRGLDVVSSYKLKLTHSQTLQVTATLMLNQTDSINTATIKTPQVFTDNNITLMDRVGLGLIEVSQPKSKMIVTLNYTFNGFNLMLRGSRFGEVTARQKNPALDQTFTPKATFDLAFSIPIKKSNITIGGNNILNEYPDKVNSLSLTQSGQETYSRQTTQFGFMGTFYYVSLNLKF